MKFVLLILMLHLTTSMCGQGITTYFDSASFYGNIKMHLAYFNSDLQLQDNSPRIGTYISRDIKNFKISVRLEYGIHLLTGFNLNNDANSAADFIANPEVTTPVFTNRLAYAHLFHKKFGNFSIGKQWGVYYDIAGYTDGFLIFGGNANGIYTGNTDGGWKGTGRATNAVVYRVNMGNVSIGIQSQFFGYYNNFAYSLAYHSKIGLDAGIAYNNAGVSNSMQKFIDNLNNRTTNLVAGFNYHKKNLLIAMTFSNNGNELLQLDDSTVTTYPTLGYELLVNYTYKRLLIESGFNASNATQNDALTGLRYNFFFFVLGCRYNVAPNTQIYLTGRLSHLENYSSLKLTSALALGFMYGFDFGTRRKFSVPSY